jgi:hypothetical protein
MKLPRGERRDTAQPTRTHENIHHRRSSLPSREDEYTFRNGQLIQLHVLEKEPSVFTATGYAVTHSKCV